MTLRDRSFVFSSQAFGNALNSNALIAGFLVEFDLPAAVNNPWHLAASPRLLTINPSGANGIYGLLFACFVLSADENSPPPATCAQLAVRDYCNRTALNWVQRIPADPLLGIDQANPWQLYRCVSSYELFIPFCSPISRQFLKRVHLCAAATPCKS